MRLLVLTQAIDRDDLYLGFFERWVEELSRHADEVTVVCLKRGAYTLPPNVRVLSLGKEEGVGKMGRIMRFFRHIWAARYDTVLVHMNQEYILLGGWYWKLMGKRVYMWRNHYAGNFLTDIAAALCTKVFCTSKYSYTAKYKKAVLMPVGVDLERYQPQSVSRTPRSLLFYARMAPSKRPDMLVEALGMLKSRGVEFRAHLYGSALPADKLYLTELKDRVGALGLVQDVTFMPGAPHSEGPAIFSAHEIYVDPSRSGMFNKTLFEAAACGAVALAVSDDWQKLMGPEFSFAESPESLAAALERTLELPTEKKASLRDQQSSIIDAHSLRRLAARLAEEMR